MGKPSTAKQKMKTVALTLLLSLLAITTRAQKDINIGQMSQKYTIQNDKLEHFKVRINQENFDGKQDLIVKVIEGDLSSDPDVFISKTNQKPTNQQDSQWACSSYGKDTCSVNHEDISQGDTFYIGVRCESKCTFQIFPTMVSYVELQDGEEVQMDFKDQESKMFKIKIPAQSSRDDENKIKSIVITAAPLLPGSQDLFLSATTQTKVSPSTATLRGEPAWSKGQAIRLNENGEEWCTACTINILVDVVQAGRYSVYAKTNIGVPKLYAGKKIDDVVYYDNKVCYSYYVKDAKKDVEIRTIQYSGMVDFFINSGEVTTKNDDSIYSGTKSQNSFIRITAKERQRSRLQQTGIYYICLYAHLTSTYSLMVTEVEPNVNFNYLEDGFIENGEVQGKDLVVYLYKVPPLEYAGEDINLNFQLQVTNGPVPILAVEFCQESDYKRCVKDISRSYVLDKTGSFKKATNQNNQLNLEYDHSETECDKYQGGCYYTVVVVGNAEGDQNYTKYELQVVHSQNNYIILQESQQISDYVHTGIYRYYKFTVLDSNNLRNVSIIMSTLHGDADLFISRKEPFPTKYQYEKSSQKSYGVSDFVYFDNDDGGSIATTYYIGVHGYQYSTFTLQVRLDRGENSVNWVPLLQEGIQTRGYITDKFAHDQYRFSVKMAEGYEKSIKVQVSPFEGRVKMYVRYENQASKDEYNWETTNNLVVIKTDDANFHREGTYYVAIYPEFTFWELFSATNYGFMLSYTSEQQFSYLQANTPLEVSQDEWSTYYYRHFISDLSSDVKLSMTTISGNPSIYIGLSPNKKWPTRDNQDMQSQGGSVSQGKSFVFTTTQLKKANPACVSNANQVGEVCAIYIGVNCEGGCRYSLKVSYDDSLSHQLTFGMPQHDSVEAGEYNYYYLNVRKDKQQDIYAVLTTLTGNADIFVSMEPSPSTNDIRQWKMPTEKNNVLKSTETLTQDVIRIMPSDLEQCFNARGNDLKECAIIVGVYGAKTQDNKSTTSRYNLVIYADVAVLINNSPLSNTVEQGKYHYYIYQAHCDNCTIIVSLSTFGTGDPDLYIGVGDKRLPTKTDYDMKSATYKSEAAEFDLTHPFFQVNRMSTLKGTYIIGVYGSKNSTYQLMVTQEEHSFVMIQDGLSVKRTQNSYDTSFFKWHNWQEKDIKISLEVKHGLADIYISTYDENDITQNFVERIPNTKKHTKWRVENIKPTATIDERSLLIKAQERNYCVNCYYLIGIVTHEQDTEFVLQLDNIDATFQNSQFLRIGESYTDKLKKGEKKTFKFLVDEKSKIRIQHNTVKGDIRLELGLTDQGKDAFYVNEGSGIYTIETDNANFQSGRIYYMPIRNRGDEAAEFTLLITTDRSITALSDGVPLKLRYDGAQDLSKFLTFSIPQGNSTVQIQVKSKTENFFPTLYYKFYEDIDASLNSIQFPPGGEQFMRLKQWDESLGLMTFQKEFKNVKGKKAGLAMNLFDNSYVRAVHSYDDAIITASYSDTTTMILNTWLIGTILQENSFLLYKVDSPDLKKQGSLIVEFAECIGESSVRFLTHPDQASSKAGKIEAVEHLDLGKTYYFVNLPQDSIYIQVQPKVFSEKGVDGLKTEFLIKASYSATQNTANNIYNLPNGGEIKYDMITPNSFNITWGELLYIKGENKKVPLYRTFNRGEILYNIIETKELRAKLNSICALRKEFIEAYDFRIFQSHDPFMVLSYSEGGQSFQFNVIAQITSSGVVDGDIVPYKPVLVEMKTSTQAFFKNLAYWLLVLIAIGLSLSVAVFYFKKTGKVIEYKQQREYEMTDVNQSNQSYVAPDEFKNLV